jgi:hypothetical protein
LKVLKRSKNAKSSGGAEATTMASIDRIIEELRSKKANEEVVMVAKVAKNKRLEQRFCLQKRSKLEILRLKTKPST